MGAMLNNPTEPYYISIGAAADNPRLPATKNTAIHGFLILRSDRTLPLNGNKCSLFDEEELNARIGQPPARRTK